jgi:hypothetical protein
MAVMPNRETALMFPIVGRERWHSRMLDSVFQGVRSNGAFNEIVDT